MNSRAKKAKNKDRIKVLREFKRDILGDGTTELSKGAELAVYEEAVKDAMSALVAFADVKLGPARLVEYAGLIVGGCIGRLGKDEVNRILIRGIAKATIALAQRETP